MASRSRDPEVRTQALEALLADDPASPAFFPLAGLIWEKGEADKAIDMLTVGLQQHPAYSAPRVLLGEIHLAKEQVTEAIGELEKAVARTPWNLAAQRLLLDCFQRSDDKAGARKARVAIGMFDPSDEEAFAALDDALAPPGAGPPPPVQDEAPLDEAVDAVPTPSLAELYVSQGHIDKALNVYTSLAEEDPENTEYMEKITELQAQLAEGGDALDDALGDDGSAGAELDDFDSILDEAGEDAGTPEVEDFDSILDEAGDAADAGGDTEGELDDFDSILDEAGEDAGASEVEDFDSLLDEAGGAADAGGDTEGELDDFDSLLDEAEGDTEAVAEAPGEEFGGSSDGGLDDFDSLLEEAGDVSTSDAVAAPAEAETPAAEAADEPAGEVDDLDALFADEPAEVSQPSEAPADESAGDDLDALFADEFDEPKAAAGAAEEVAPAGEAEELPAGEAEESSVAEEEVAALEEEASAPEVDAEAGGALDEFDSFLADEPEGAVEEEMPVEEVEVEEAAAEEASAPDFEEMDALLADEFGEPEAVAEEEMPVAEAEEEVPALEEASVPEVDAEAGGALDEFESLLAEEPVGAADAEVFEEDAGEETAGAAPDLDELDSLLAEEPEVEPASASVEGADLDALLIDEPEVAEEAPMIEADDAPRRHVMQGIIEVYLQEENYDMALDVCRKALLAGPSSEWLVMQIQELEEIVGERMKRDLLQPDEEDIEDAVLESPEDSEVVRSLLGWLETIQRRRAKMSADSQRGLSDDIV